jgi:hypothetical protein
MADPKSDPKKYRYVFEPMVPKELLEPLDWAIEGLMPFNGITCLFGMPGSFKTFEAIAMAACKATGLEFCGHWVGPPCKVGYIAADAPKGAKLRAKAWVQTHQDILDEQDIDEEMLDTNLKVLEIPVNLHMPHEVSEAIRQLTEQKFECEILVVDTLFHSSIGAKLTVPEEILPLLEHLKLLMEAVGAKACLLVHHTTKDGEEFFGSVSFLATMEAMIRSESKDLTTAKVSCVRMREGPFFHAFEITFTTQMVKTKPDRRGVDEFELLVVGSAAPAAEKKTDKEIREHELDELMWITALNLSQPPDRLIQYHAWFELTKAQRGGKLGTETFSKAVKRLVAKGSVRKIGDLYQVVIEGAAKAEKAASGPNTSTPAMSASLLPASRSKEREVPEVNKALLEALPEVPEVTSIGSGNGKDSVVPDAAEDAVQQLTRK